MHIYGDHNDEVTTPQSLAKSIKRMTPRVQKWLDDYRKAPDHVITHLVMTGISGQSVGWPLSAAVQLPAVVVRKDGEKAHSGLIVGQGDVKDYILVDDFISTGSTIDRVVTALLQEHFRQPPPPPYMLTSLPYDKAKTAPICRAIFAHRRGYTHSDFDSLHAHDYRPRISREGDAPMIPADFVHPAIPVIGPHDYHD